MIAWFEHRGYTASSIGDAPVSLVSDEIRLGGVTLRRVWHTAMRVQATGTLVSHHQATRAVKTVLHVDGTAQMVFDDLSIVVTPHNALCFAGHRFRSQSSQTPVARIEVETKGVALDAASTRVLSNEAAPTLMTSILAGTANALLNADAPIPPRVATELARSVDLLLLAALDEHHPDDAHRASTPSSDTLYRRATECLRDNAHDPAMTVSGLAATMGVTRQHLARSFAAQGTTPIAEIRAHRVRRVDVLRSAGVADDDELARLAGFPSTWAMRKAISAGLRTDATE